MRTTPDKASIFNESIISQLYKKFTAYLLSSFIEFFAAYLCFHHQHIVSSLVTLLDSDSK